MKEYLAKINLSREQLAVWQHKIMRYSLPIFIIFVALIYTFVVFRIHSLSSAQPSDAEVQKQVQAAQIPHIDKAVVQQLESLQDNSVNAQALFNQARSNPFQ